jgi:hypothetical protein
MKSTTDSTTNNPQKHGSHNRQPIAVLSHPNMYSAIIICRNKCTRQTQYSFQQTTEAPHTFPYPNSETLTMTSNELWNVNTLELPSTIAAANNPTPYRSLATVLSDEHAELEETRKPKAAELAKFQSKHKELDRKVIHIRASLEREHKTLAELTAQTKTLQASTKKQEKELAGINKSIHNLVDAVAPIREEILAIVAQLLKKRTEEKAASDAEAEATHRSSILLECHQSNGKVFMTAMKKYYKFSEWKSTNNNRNIGPQTEAIPLVFFDIPCFFSRTELEVFLGYKSPNHNVDGALTKMVEEKMLVNATNKVAVTSTRQSTKRGFQTR